MKNYKWSLIVILSFYASAFYGQDTTIIHTDKINIRCFSNKRMGIYKSEIELDSSIKKISPNANFIKNCRNESFPEINFSEKNLVVIFSSCGGCTRPDVTYKLYKILSKKKYFFLVKFEQHGFCKPKETHISIMELIPKIEEDYSFEYKIEKTIK